VARGLSRLPGTCPIALRESRSRGEHRGLPQVVSGCGTPPSRSRPGIRKAESRRGSRPIGAPHAGSLRPGDSVPLRALPHHVVETAYERGWQLLTNGELLDAAEAAGLEVLVTTDQGLRYQQNLSKRRIRILVLTTTSWPKIGKYTDMVAGVIDGLAAGEHPEISFPS
jgi:hypothetical protein